MPVRFRSFVVAIAAALIPGAMRAQIIGGGLRGSTVALSANIPMGKLDTTATTGFGFVWRRGFANAEDVWVARTTLGFDRFGGRGSLDNVQFISFGLDVVHNPLASWYQFGGFSQSMVRYEYKPNAPPTSSIGQTSDFSFGFSGGVGVNIGSGATKTFIEVAATTTFTRSGNSSWFPVRFGLRF